MVGFTGVVWDSRPLPKLAADLAHGRGPIPISEAGQAHAKIAAVLAEVSVEYAQILADIGTHWESATYNHAMGKIAQLAPWFADIATKATEAAGRAEVQAAANTVALLTMPGIEEIEFGEHIQKLLESASTSVGVPMTGGLAAAERARADQKQRAARVMQSYENATTPVAAPWTMPKPPQVASDGALAAEQAAAKAAADRVKAAQSPTPSTPLAPPMIGGLGGLGGGYQRPKGAHVVTPLVAEPAPAGTAPQQATPVRSAGMTPPMAPGAAAAGAGRDEEHTDTTAVPAPAAGLDDAVNLPSGWLGAAVHADAAVSWENLEDNASGDRLPPEGVLNLAAPPVIGTAEGGH